MVRVPCLREGRISRLHDPLRLRRTIESVSIRVNPCRKRVVGYREERCAVHTLRLDVALPVDRFLFRLPALRLGVPARDLRLVDLALARAACPFAGFFFLNLAIIFL